MDERSLAGLRMALNDCLFERGDIDERLYRLAKIALEEDLTRASGESTIMVEERHGYH